MVRSQGVEAYLVRYEDKHRYPEHAPPPASKEAPSLSAMAYVEVSTDERYEIVVTLTADFDFKDSPDVRIVWDTDGRGRHRCYSAKELQETIKSKGKRSITFSSRPAMVDGELMDCGLTFTDLHIGSSSSAVYLWL
jgi:hypothetical protein